MATITFRGQPMTLQGAALAAGEVMPDFTLSSNDLAPIRLADLTGTRVFLAVPSLDTPVCDLEVRTFNAKAADLAGVSVLEVSMDLPFAQARWCGAAGVENVRTLSDYKDRSFAAATGTLIEELGLLARAVFVVNPAGVLTHVEYVAETTDPPNYAAALAAAEAASQA
jgi:thiol peroxidase